MSADFIFSNAATTIREQRGGNLSYLVPNLWYVSTFLLHIELSICFIVLGPQVKFDFLPDAFSTPRCFQSWMPHQFSSIVTPAFISPLSAFTVPYISSPSIYFLAVNLHLRVLAPFLSTTSKPVFLLLQSQHHPVLASACSTCQYSKIWLHFSTVFTHRMYY